MSAVRWGILSTGRIAEQFAHDVGFVEQARIRAVSSRALANAEAFAQRHGVDHVYPDLARLLDDDAVDAVYVATPHSLHLRNALQALDAGKPVLCEKPLVTSVADGERLVDAARTSGVYLMEAMWTWFLPAIHEAKRWVDEGRIGRLVQIKADFGYPQRPYAPDRREYDASLGGGALLEMGIYPVALLWLFLGRQPDRVVVSSRHAPNGVEDDVSAILEYDGMCTATIGTSFRCKLQNWAYLIGENGYVAIPDFWRASACYRYELETCVERFEDNRRSIGLSYEINAVTEDLREGRRESTVVTLADSLAFQETMAAIRAGFSRARPDRD